MTPLSLFLKISFGVLLALLTFDWSDGQGILTRRYRTVCYDDKQPNCNESFIDIYKNLSRSANNLSVADTYFWLFTNKNKKKPESLHKCGGNLPPKSKFNPNKELIVIISPYIAGICDFAVYREWMFQIFKKGKYNVLMVDWSWGSKSEYHTSIANGKIAAKQLAIVLRNIQNKTGIKKEKISLVGHSLASHIAGWVGQEFPVGRITGIDPAGPAFHNDIPIDDRLDPTDADLVDVWHCNAGDCLPYLGINYDAGDIDFWINGGTTQESCKQTIFSSFLRGDLTYAIENMQPQGCSHVHCTKYYLASINPGQCQYVGVACDSYEKFKAGKCRRCGEKGENCTIMGFDTGKYYKKDAEYSQRYYVETSNDCPYCDNSHLKLEGFAQTYKKSLQPEEKSVIDKIKDKIKNPFS